MQLIIYNWKKSDESVVACGENNEVCCSGVENFISDVFSSACHSVVHFFLFLARLFRTSSVPRKSRVDGKDAVFFMCV